MNHRDQLDFLIRRSQHVYQSYREEPVYLKALMIKNANQEIISLLTNQGYLFDNDGAVNQLLDHFEGWLYQFVHHERQDFALGDRFIFERMEQVIAYPTEAIDQLLKK